MRNEGVGQVIIEVEDQDRALEFWSNTVGFELAHDAPFTEALNNVEKYVASTTLKEPLPWNNSTLLEGDAADAVAGLKERPGRISWSLAAGNRSSR